MKGSRDLIPDSTVADYQRDGAICIRGAFRDWVKPLSKAVELNMANPGPLGKEQLTEGEPGRFFSDMCNWRRFREYRDFVFESPAAEIAARAMRSGTAQFFHEHVLVKEPGTFKLTPWHHDMPYYCVEGEQTVSIWLALDEVERSACVNFVAKSHRWGKRFHPVYFRDASEFDHEDNHYAPLPDLEADSDAYSLLAWDLEPGDAILFHFLTLHGTGAVEIKGWRRGFSTRWIGDDVRYIDRPGATSPPFPNIGLNPGDRMPEHSFPVVWRSPDAQP